MTAFLLWPLAFLQLAPRDAAHLVRPLTHLGLAQLISRVVDGPGASPYRASGHLSLMREMTAALVPDGFLSPIPDAQKVRDAATRRVPARVS